MIIILLGYNINFKIICYVIIVVFLRMCLLFYECKM